MRGVDSHSKPRRAERRGRVAPLVEWDITTISDGGAGGRASAGRGNAPKRPNETRRVFRLFRTRRQHENGGNNLGNGARSLLLAGRGADGAAPAGHLVDRGNGADLRMVRRVDAPELEVRGDTGGAGYRRRGGRTVIFVCHVAPGRGQPAGRMGRIDRRGRGHVRAFRPDPTDWIRRRRTVGVLRRGDDCGAVGSQATRRRRQGGALFRGRLRNRNGRQACRRVGDGRDPVDESRPLCGGAGRRGLDGRRPECPNGAATD